MRLMITLLAALSLWGCTKPPKPRADGAHHWVSVKIPDNVRIEFDWVCDANGRTDDGAVEIFPGLDTSWSVYVRGASFGEFATADQGKAQVEKIYRENGDTCP